MASLRLSLGGSHYSNSSRSRAQTRTHAHISLHNWTAANPSALSASTQQQHAHVTSSPLSVARSTDDVLHPAFQRRHISTRLQAQADNALAFIVIIAVRSALPQLYPAQPIKQQSLNPNPNRNFLYRAPSSSSAFVGVCTHKRTSCSRLAVSKSTQDCHQQQFLPAVGLLVQHTWCVAALGTQHNQYNKVLVQQQATAAGQLGLPRHHSCHTA